MSAMALLSLLLSALNFQLVFAICRLENEPVYVGCFEDSSDRALYRPSLKIDAEEFVEYCVRRCLESQQMKYIYAGLKHKSECFCGNNKDCDKHYERADFECQDKCMGNSCQICGDSWCLSVYKKSPGVCTNDIGPPENGDCTITNLPPLICYFNKLIFFRILVDFSCDPGYTLHGASSIECLYNSNNGETWRSDSVPTCEVPTTMVEFTTMLTTTTVAQSTLNYQSTTDPSTTDPSTTDPSTTDPSTTDPSTTDPSTTDPSTTDPLTTHPSTTHPSTTDPSTTDPSTTDPSTTDPSTTYEKSAIANSSSSTPVGSETRETDKEPPEISNCPEDVTIPVSSSTARVSYSWIPPTFLDSSDADVDVTYSCRGSSHHQCSRAGSGFFSAGVTVVMYKGRDRSGNENVCQFSVTVVGQCASETVDGLTWPVTSAGSVVESIQRCLLMTTNAGEPLAVRNCSVVQPPVYFQWEEPEHRSCGKERTDVTIEDVVKVEVSTGNAVEVAGFLANETSESTSGDAQDVEVVSGILMNIIQAQSGDSEVTELVLEAVNNVIRAGVEADTPDSRRSSSEIVRSVEKQVALTLQEEGRVSIRQETVHVEAVSLDPEENRDGFSFASVRKPGPGTTEKGSLVGTAVQTFGDDIPADIDVVASVQLPRGILDSLPTIEANNSTLLQVSFLIYADDTLFHSSSIRRHQEETNSTRKVAGPVVSLTVENVKLVNLTEPLVVTFKAPDEEFVAGVTTTQCVFWDFDLEDGIGDWSTVGCTRSGLSSEVVSCECNHATNFAILMDVKGQQIMNRALDIISQVGCALSIAALVTTLIIYLSIRKLRTGKSRQIFIHFCFSLLMLYIVFLAGVDNAKGGACVFVSALLHYLTLSTMMWMAVEARNVYVHTVRVFPEDTPRYMIKACLIAWGFPLLVLTVTLATAVHHYDNELYCFLKPDLVLYIALLAPVAVILAHNIITFILVMRSLLKVREVSRSQQISKRLQNAVGISVLVGLTWAFGFLAINKATFVFQLIFCLANSLQGVVVCIMFCIRRDEVRTTVAPYIRRLCCCNAPARPGREQRYHLPGVSQSAASPSVSKV